MSSQGGFAPPYPPEKRLRRARTFVVTIGFSAHDGAEPPEETFWDGISSRSRGCTVQAWNALSDVVSGLSRANSAGLRG
eukprot:12627569-Alexandrium_andersonii.AAC.1